jgi:hypothetical protein
MPCKRYHFQHTGQRDYQRAAAAAESAPLQVISQLNVAAASGYVQRRAAVPAQRPHTSVAWQATANHSSAPSHTAPLSQSDICRRLQQQLRSLHTTVDSGKVQRGAAVPARQTVTLWGPSTRKHTDFRHTAQIIALVWRVHVCACSQEHSRHFQATSVRGDMQRIPPAPAHKLSQRDSWQSAAGEQHAMQSQRICHWCQYAMG